MNNFPLISIIIPSYNRFNYLCRTIDSIKNQTYTNYEIIVVNDNSTEPEYLTKEIENVKMIHLKENSKTLFGYACAGYIRNVGVENSKGDYIAFVDDDDWWTENKLEMQITKMLTENAEFSSTEGFLYKGEQNLNECKKYNSEFYWDYLSKKCNLENKFPQWWDLNFLKIHNCIITSSVMIKKSLFQKIGGMRYLKNGEEDYDCWLRCLQYNNTKLLYINEPLFYYDDFHGYGRNY